MRTCLACDGMIVGRIDKKFCDHNCRNAYHNDRNRSSRNYVQKVNRNLARNYRILEDLTENEVAEVTLPVLKAMGFDPQYFTSYARDEDEGPIYFVYDLSYQQNANNLVIRIKELETYRNSA
ncbi:hypothetical protein [Croceimicrobium sp.]|uniref:hypothetical protein n=1 Tax=Croceimicrobium sp. TaxID=2828340 RepID=UPI003BAA8427